jgi:hypothetical protein
MKEQHKKSKPLWLISPAVPAEAASAFNLLLVPSCIP